MQFSLSQGPSHKTQPLRPGYLAYCVSIAGAAHMNFSDVPFLEGDRRGIGPLRALAIANAYTRAFFDRYLRGRPSPLLDASEFPEAKLEKVAPQSH